MSSGTGPLCFIVWVPNRKIKLQAVSWRLSVHWGIWAEENSFAVLCFPVELTREQDTCALDAEFKGLPKPSLIK